MSQATFPRHLLCLLGFAFSSAFINKASAQSETETPAQPTTLSAPIVQVYYVPLVEAHVQTAFLNIDTTGAPVSQSVKNTTSLVTPIAGTIITYDHWEDGFEAVAASPVQPTTQVWGDGKVSNGAPPEYPNDVFPAGAVITLITKVNLPRDPDAVVYDARDRICVTQPIAFSRSAWATSPGTVLASATEVYDTQKWGTSYAIPIGVASSANELFEYSSLQIMAAENGTTVDVDLDHNGSIDQTQTLAAGESLFVDGNVQPGTLVTASGPIQVHEITGDIGAAYESRTFALLPTSAWGSDYYCPVATTSSDAATTVFLFNPAASAITVNATVTGGSSVINVAAGSNAAFTMPMGSAARFTSVGAVPFYAVAAGDSGGSADFNNAYEWGCSLLPASSLTSEVAIGFAPGSDDRVSPVGPDEDGSPVWVTSTASTTVYVNYSGDYAAGAFTATNGRKYDVAVPISALEFTTISDPSDKDMTKSLLFTTDGAHLVCAWAPNPAAASLGAPGIDVATALPPFTTP